MSAVHVERLPAAGQWIGGRWTEPGEDAVSLNPARPREEIGRHAVADAAQVDQAVEAAGAALGPWQRVRMTDRGRILRHCGRLIEASAETLAVLLTREEGKTLPEARAEVQKAADAFTYQGAQGWAPTGETYASPNPDEEIRTVHVPVGVVAAITPWNFPVAIPAWKIAPALLYGNAVVWKPASLTPIVAVALARILGEAGLPPGALNLILAPGDVAERLALHPGVDAVTFTGSTAVGTHLWREVTARGGMAQAEMGGHNPAIVFADADLDLAAGEIVAGAMWSTGQKCTATRRAIVHRSVHDDLLQRVVERVGALRAGDGLDDRNHLGPLVSPAAREEVVAAIARAVGEGCAVAGEGQVDERGEGHLVAPTVLVGVRPGMEIARDEVFGPVLGVIAVDDDDEAIATANATRYGLSAAVFTRSERRLRRVVEEVRAGMIHLNNQTPGSEIHVPFAGMGDSSAFAPGEQGRAAREFFTRRKTVFARPGER